MVETGSFAESGLAQSGREVGKPACHILKCFSVTTEEGFFEA